MPAYFLVRARIAEGVVKGDFDRWYGDEHMPDALRTFEAKRAWRAWGDRVARSRDFIETVPKAGG